jgi:hypothetical protein
MATTTDTDTELSAVNSILGASGQAPITVLNYENPEISFIYNILTEVNKDVQNEGWHFNTEYHVKTTPDGNGYVSLPTNTLRYDLNEDEHDKSQDLVVRSGRLYDLADHTDVFTADLYLDLVTLYAFGDLPNPFQRYITYRAASRAATQLVSNPQLVQLLQQQEASSRATCMEYECSQGDHNYMGFTHGTAGYKTFKPIDALVRS